MVLVEWKVGRDWRVEAAVSPLVRVREPRKRTRLGWVVTRRLAISCPGGSLERVRKDESPWRRTHVSNASISAAEEDGGCRHRELKGF